MRILLNLFFTFCLYSFVHANASHQSEFPTSVFSQIKNSNREVFSMNQAWLFHKGDIKGAEQLNYDDSKWNMVSLPNGITYMPTEPGGCINYQGVVWYRKYFNIYNRLKGKKIFLHFEAIMGKSKIYMNGKLLKEHLGGYLPVILDITNHIDWKKRNIIAVWADNSFPSGKPQASLCYTYFGGIYRNCWLVAHDKIFIADVDYEDEIVGGDKFISFDNVSSKTVQINLKAHLRNDSENEFTGILEYVLEETDGKQAAIINDKVNIKTGKTIYTKNQITISNPKLFSPDSPYLYNLYVYLRNNEGEIIDGYRKRIGIPNI